MNEKILKNADLDEKVAEIAANTAVDLEDVSVVDLSKEYVINGEKTKKLKMDLNGLTGMDMLKAEKLARLRKDETGNIMFSMTYQLTLAAMAAKVPLDELLKLPAKELKSVLAEIYAFLFA